MNSKCGSTLYWANCYKGTYDLIAPDSIAHPAKMSPALCFKIFEHLKELGLLKEGDTVLDPMAGTGITAIVAGAQGYPAITIELEDKFVGFQKQNKEYAERKLYKTLDWQIIQGDSRKLSELLEVRGLKSITSPPYGDQVIKDGQRLASNPDIHWREWDRGTGYNLKNPDNIGNLPDKPLKAITSPPYGIDKTSGGLNTKPPRDATEGQIGNLPDKPLKTVTSPPYEQSITGGKSGIEWQEDWGKPSENRQPSQDIDYGITEGQIGNEQAESYLEAMQLVYSEITKVSDVLVVVVKNPTRGGKLRRLDLDTISVLQQSGWEIYCQHRAILFEKLEQSDLFGGSKKQVKGRLSFFKRLSWNKGSPVASWEDIIFAVKK